MFPYFASLFFLMFVFVGSMVHRPRRPLEICPWTVLIINEDFPEMWVEGVNLLLLSIRPFLFVRLSVSTVVGKSVGRSVGYWGGEGLYLSRANARSQQLCILSPSGDEISHVKFHMWNFTCEFHIWKFTCILTCEISHVKFPVWITCGFSHVKFHLWHFTCEVSHVKFHMWSFTCEISHVKLHMWFTCGISHVKFHMWFTREISHVKFHMWNFTCEISHVKIHVFHTSFHMGSSNNTCEMGIFTGVSHGFHMCITYFFTRVSHVFHLRFTCVSHTYFCKGIYIYIHIHIYNICIHILNFSYIAWKQFNAFALIPRGVWT